MLDLKGAHLPKFLAGAIHFLFGAVGGNSSPRNPVSSVKTPSRSLSQCTRLPLVPSSVAHRRSLLMGLRYPFRGGEEGYASVECDSNSLSLARILTFLGNFSAYFSRVQRHAQSHVRTCVYGSPGPSAARTSDRLLLLRAAVIVTQRKPFMGFSFLRLFFLCTAQLAACKACLRCASRPQHALHPRGSTRNSPNCITNHTKKETFR